MRGPCRAFAAAVACCALVPLAARARPLVNLQVTVDPKARRATGEVRIALDNPTDKPLDRIELWDFPARLVRTPDGITDYNFYSVFPWRVSRAAMKMDSVSVDGKPAAARVRDAATAGKGTLIELPIDPPLAPGARAEVAARFTTTIPERFGAFGCFRGACRMAGGFFPMLVELGPSGWDESAPPARADYQVALRAPPGTQPFIDGRPRDRAELANAAYPMVSVERGTNERTRTHRGVLLRYSSHSPAPDPPLPPGKAGPYLGEDLAARVLDEAADALDLLAELNLPLPDGEVDLVEAPLRLELAEPHAGCVLVSDQIFRILPADRFRKFHAFQLVRAIYALSAARRLAEGGELPADLAWSPDVAASWLVDLFTVRTYRRAEFAADVLKWVSFIPTVDRILYAPQVPFASAYFNTLDEPDPTRDALERFANLRPRGKTIYEKLRDRLGDAGGARAAELVFRGAPVRRAAAAIEAQAPGPGSQALSLDDFFAQWLRPYPPVDYRFALLGTERAGAKWRSRIRLWKRGDKPPVEPVDLRVTEWGGARHDLTWDGAGSETILVVETERRIRSIELDPRGRLLERLPGANDDLKLDDRKPAPLKFIYNNFGGLINFQNLSLDLSLDFTLARILDVKNAARFLIYRSQTAQVGLEAVYGRSWGRMITPSHLSSGASITVDVARLEGSFGRVGETPLPGTRLTLAAAVGYDDRTFIWEPRKALSAAIGASYTLTVQDSGRVLQQSTVSGDLEQIVPLAAGQGLAWLIGGAVTFGNLGVPTQMLSLGAPVWLRGYEPDELLGRLRIATRIEWRHNFIHDLDWNLFHVLYVRGIAGAAFAEAGMVSPCESYALSGDDLFYDLGYSLRIFEDWFGVSQTMFNVDLAVPLVRRTRGCFQEAGVPPRPASTRSPVGVFVYWGPVW